MNINRDNYESILVDYAEGGLSAKQRQEVEKFLMMHPDIREEFDMFQADLVEVADEIFTDKERLKKIPFQQTAASSDYFQQLCVAHIEGILSEKEQAILYKMVKEDTQKQKELLLFEKTKLITDQEIFNEKLLMKKADVIHQITDSNFEEYCVACMEGWLDQKGLLALNNYLANNPQQQGVLHIYQQSRLTPDLSIVYPDKRKIKRFTLLSLNTKKVISVLSSAAAILVFGLMIFYTQTLDDTTQLSSHVASQIKDASPVASESSEKINADLPEEITRTKIKTVLHDPFGFEKISSAAKPTTTLASITYRTDMDLMQPIRVKALECAPCNNIFEEKQLIQGMQSAHFKEEIPDRNARKESIPEKKEDRPDQTGVWQLAQAGITGFNKFTNSELRVTKNQENNKTKIAFKSKYFSFSTQVNQKN